MVIKAQMNKVIFKERWFLFFQQRGTKKKILSAHEELYLRPSESLFHAVEKIKFHLSLFLYRAQNLPSLQFQCNL